MPKPTLFGKLLKTNTFGRGSTAILGDICAKCGLRKMYVKTTEMPPSGQGELGILVLGEAPGTEEDIEGTQWVGRAGKLLRKYFDSIGIDLDRDCWKLNACNCHPVSNKTPTKTQIRCCREKMVRKTIQEFKPKYIVAVGAIACESLFGEFQTVRSILPWTCRAIPDPEWNAWILPIFHPSYLLRNEYDLNLQSYYSKCFEFIKKFIIENPEHPTFPDYKKQVTNLLNFEEVKQLLKKVLREKPRHLVFDYETSGLRPYEPDHSIASISLSTDSSSAHAFPYMYRNHFDSDQQKVIRRLWSKILEDPKIRKIAHNLKFEMRWSKAFFGPVKNAYRCTMVTSHVLDNRTGVTGLKFQAYVRYGVKKYNDNVETFLRASKGVYNKVHQIPLKELLTYNALDSLFTYKLFEDQNRELQNGLKNANRFFHKGLLALSEIEEVGMNIDQTYYMDMDQKLEKQIQSLTAKLLNSREAKKFQEKTKEKLNLNSTPHLRTLATTILKVKVDRTTRTGLMSMDAQALQDMNHPFLNEILKLRKLEKIKGTYLSPFLKLVAPDGRIHPNFNLHIARTYRSSSDSPNFQNIPVRDEKAKKIVRGGIIPSPGNQILEGDFSGIEVGISCCYHKDRSMIRYVTDPSTDMHRDSAMDIWKLGKNQVTKRIRFFAKNNWVFPQFYGDWYKSCAKSLWKNCIDLKTAEGVTLRNHLRKKGIHSYVSFEAHCQHAEEIFWKKRFREYDAWKKDISKFYRKHGYVETHLGFRFRGYMSSKECSNYPIQGTAFHCLLWSLIEISKEMRKRKLRTRIIGQIHDSIVWDLVPDEKEEVVDLARNIMEVKIRETFDWIIVPLKVDFEITGIDKPWSEKEDLE